MHHCSRADLGIVALLATLGGPHACTPEPDKVVLSRVVIDAPAEFDRAVDARKQARRVLHERLEADESVEFGSRPKATHRLHVRIHSRTDLGDGDRRPVQVTLQNLGREPFFEAVGQAAEGGTLFQVVTEGFEDAWGALSRMRQLYVAKEEALLEALGHEDIRIRAFAVERLGSRRSKAAVAPLCALLTAEEQPELMLRAIGALVNIGDQRAVAPLIDLTHRKEPEFVLQVVFAVSAIGGRAAEGFLVTLASGHPNPEIQQGAKDALAEMQQRAAAPAP